VRRRNTALLLPLRRHELAAKDCLVVTLLRTRQAYSIVCHCSIETLPAAEREAGRHTATELLPPCFSTLTRRKAARTLLPGSCRPTEVAWYWAFQTCGYRDAEARPLADALSVVVGTETYASAAVAALRVLTFATGPQFLPYAAFLASALDLLASQPPVPVLVLGELAPTDEMTMASSVRRLLQTPVFMRQLGDVAATLLIDAWRRLERSGVLETRLLGRVNEPLKPSGSLKARLEAAAAEGAARGLHTCALAGCAAKEAHVSHFKKCGACKTVAYCCKEHQVEDWPSHKAACKAARNLKVAAPANDP
jgi:hypothetical protein